MAKMRLHWFCLVYYTILKKLTSTICREDHRRIRNHRTRSERQAFSHGVVLFVSIVAQLMVVVIDDDTWVMLMLVVFVLLAR